MTNINNDLSHSTLAEASQALSFEELTTVTGGGTVTLGPASDACVSVVGTDITNPPNLMDPNSTQPQRLAVGRANALHDLINNPVCKATPRDQLLKVAMIQGQFIGQSLGNQTLPATW